MNRSQEMTQREVIVISPERGISPTLREGSDWAHGKEEPSLTVGLVPARISQRTPETPHQFCLVYFGGRFLPLQPAKAPFHSHLSPNAFR